MSELPIQPSDGTRQAAQAPASRLTLRSGRTGSAVSETLWSQVGGTATFDRLVRGFYERVKQDDILSPMYPHDDWEGAIWRLRSFLEQYWGGPTDYSEKRGHPRLRMRHQAFRVTPAARDRWLKLMNEALDDVELSPMHDTAMRDYIDRAAHALVNTFE
jgi:hemoglobin